jgi:hypothetical protein
MSVSRFDLLIFFKDNLAKFLNALIEQLPSEGDLVMLRVMLMDQIPVEDALNVFTSRIIPHKKMILVKDEAFFTRSDTNIFEGLQKDKVNYFLKLWSSKNFSSDDREQIWKWLQLFLKIAEKWNSLEISGRS